MTEIILMAGTSVIGAYAFFHGMGRAVVENQVDEMNLKLIRLRTEIMKTEKSSDEKIISTTYRRLH